jgi:hypothetical protein
MPLKIGILGCQSKHAEFFGMLFNVNKSFPGCRIPFIFGDDEPSRLDYVCNKAKISKICQSTEELIEKSDAVLITYRMAERHFNPAMACMAQGKPVFVDKPFTIIQEQAQILVDTSLEKGISLMGGSTLCFDPQLSEVYKAALSSPLGIIAYRADANSPFGGYRFYGSHLTDLCATIFGVFATAARAIRINDAVNILVNYPDRTVMLHSNPDFEKPEIKFSKGSGLVSITLDDINCYRYGMQAFVRAIKTHQPDPIKLQQLTFSTKLLNAIMKSLDKGIKIEIS